MTGNSLFDRASLEDAQVNDVSDSLLQSSERRFLGVRNRPGIGIQEY